MDTKIVNLDDCLVVTFSTGERTESLNDYCFAQLGFNNRITLSGSDGFHDKFLRFAKLAVESKYAYFIRNDADRLVFSGIYDLISLLEKDETISWATGTYYDYLMNRFRCGTPSVHRKDNLQYLVDNPELMKDVQKPEATYATSIKNRFKLADVNIFTNLHEYEQYPSKVCNAFLNRLARGHYPRLYDDRYLRNLPDVYKSAVQHAFSVHSQQGSKNSMKFQDFSFLDEDFHEIPDSDLASLYEKYLNMFNTLKSNK